MSEEIQKSDTSVCSSSSARGGSSSRGRGGGYVPKKKIHEQIQSLELNESMGKDGTVTAISPLKKPGTDSSSSDSDSDLELAQGKRCDFCGDASHQNRDCPILEQIDNQQDQPGNVKNKKVSCFYCHEEGHVKAECPKLPANGCCFYCKKEGHVKANCPEKARLEQKKQERIKLNYTFRNRKTSQERSSSTSTAVLNVYEGPQKEENGSSDSSARPQVFVPLPIAPSQIKPQVQLRSKLLSSDSELSAQQKIIRSESSEEEDEMDSFDEDNSKENHPEEAAKKEIVADQEGNEKDKAEGGDGELQTISLEIDGCVEFDSSDDDQSFFDCSEGEDEEGNKLKRIVEEDECYGEDGAMLCDGGPEVKEPMEVKEGDAGETKPAELKEQQEKGVVPKEVENKPELKEQKMPKEEHSPSA